MSEKVHCCGRHTVTQSLCALLTPQAKASTMHGAVVPLLLVVVIVDVAELLAGWLPFTVCEHD